MEEMFCGKQNSLEVWRRGTGNRERKQASASTDITEDEPKQQASFSPCQRAFQRQQKLLRTISYRSRHKSTAHPAEKKQNEMEQ
jgi:hypothetical protein